VADFTFFCGRTELTCTGAGLVVFDELEMGDETRFLLPMDCWGESGSRLRLSFFFVDVLGFLDGEDVLLCFGVA